MQLMDPQMIAKRIVVSPSPHFAVDSVAEAQKWLTGLQLLWKETLEAPTPVLIERYTLTNAHIYRWI